MTISVGTRLGPYEVLAPLGAGGMGEVYRAKDTRLGRDVAVKVLPEKYFEDKDRVARFEKEAKSLAALNHPGIAAIYSFEEVSGRHLLVMELVEGDGLDQRIAAGPLPLEEALSFAKQIAEALEAAHEKGIVHRDLKPANVKVTPDGRVKLLDFGLAKIFEGDGAVGSSPGVTHSPTLTARATAAGVILGTAAYMSPEQARGKPVDKRTDIWAFGCVFYEMLTGRRAFAGETVSDTLVAILTKEPNWVALPERTPTKIKDLLRRCLRREAKQRLHDIADARLELEELAAAASSSGHLPFEEKTGAPSPTVAGAERTKLERGSKRTLRISWAVAAAFAAAAGALITWRLARPGAAVVTPSIGELARITPPLGRAESASWSPDGNLLAYASDRSGDFDIYIRRSGGGEDVNITNDPGQDIQPAFSPDGNWIAFISTRSAKTGLIKIGYGALSRATRTYGGDLWLVPALGGSARRLAPDANYPVWRPDGRRILYVTGPESHRAIVEVPLEGGASRTILPSKDSNGDIVRIGCSPDGRWVSFENLQGIFLMPAEGGRPVKVAPGFSHAWDASSRRLWTLAKDPDGGTRVRCTDFDPERGSLRGGPRTVGLFTSYLHSLAVSRDGHRLVVTEDETSRNLTHLPLATGGGAPAGPEEPLSTGRVMDSYPQVSPDGRRVAYVSDTLGRTEVWILDLQTRRRVRLQLPGEDTLETQPAWMPNSKEIVVVRNFTNGISAGWIVALDGSHAEEVLRLRSTSVLQLHPNRNGSSLLVSELSGREQVGLLDLASRKMTSLTATPGDKFDAEWSPDGRWIALTAADKNGFLQLFRMSASGGPMQQLTTGYERMRHPFYSPDGKWIYIQPSHRNIFRVRSEGGPLEQVTHFPEAGLFLEEPAISPDGRFLVYCRENGGASLWMLTLDDHGRAP
jgi:eukaryotic-like serine/threonine-protein kinase